MGSEGFPRYACPVRRSATVTTGVPFVLAAEVEADGEEERGDGGGGEAAAQGSFMHAEGGVEEPDRRAEEPYPVEITRHSTFWDAPPGAVATSWNR